MKQIKTGPIYNGYTPDTTGKFMVGRKRRKYTYVQTQDVWQGQQLVTLKYAATDTDRVMADIAADEDKYTGVATAIHYVEDGDYRKEIAECEIIHPPAIIGGYPIKKSPYPARQSRNRAGLDTNDNDNDKLQNLLVKQPALV